MELRMITRLCLIFLLAFAPGLLCPLTAHAEWPDRPIRLIVPFAPGGGTDTFFRFFAPLLEKELGTKIIVNNMPGAGGANALAYVWKAPHDGYTWGTQCEVQFAVPVTTGSRITAKDWKYYVVGGGMNILCANKASGITNLEDFSAALQKKDAVKVAGTGGAVGFLQGVMLSKYCGLPLKAIPYSGGSLTTQACLAGETQALIQPLGEVASFIRAGQLLPLAMTTLNEPFKLEGQDIPSLVSGFEPWSRYWDALTATQFIMIPADTPAEISERITVAFIKAMQSREFAHFVETNYWQSMGYVDQAANDFTLKLESTMSYLLYDIGQAQHSPQSLGIGERP